MPNFMLVSLNARFLLKIDLICLAIKYKPFIISELTNIHPLMVKIVSARIFLIIGTEEVAAASLVVVRTFIKEKLYHGGVLNDDGHM